MPCEQALRRDRTNPNHWRHAGKDADAGENYVERLPIIQHAAKDSFFNLGSWSQVGQDSKGDVRSIAEPDAPVVTNSVGQFAPHSLNCRSGGIVEWHCYGIGHELNLTATVILVSLPLSAGGTKRKIFTLADIPGASGQEARSASALLVALPKRVDLLKATKPSYRLCLFGFAAQFANAWQPVSVNLPHRLEEGHGRRRSGHPGGRRVLVTPLRLTFRR